jgi:hypothetical protein
VRKLPLIIDFSGESMSQYFLIAIFLISTLKAAEDIAAENCKACWPVEREKLEDVIMHPSGYINPSLTPLHWLVFGCSKLDAPTVRAYAEEIFQQDKSAHVRNAGVQKLFSRPYMQGPLWTVTHIEEATPVHWMKLLAGCKAQGCIELSKIINEHEKKTVQNKK